MVVERLISTQAKLDAARATLRQLAASEGDPSLAYLVGVWQADSRKANARADALGTRCALGERALRLLIAGEPCKREIQAWEQAVKEAEG